MNVLVSAAGQDHDQCPGGASATRLGVWDQAELAKIDLGELARITLSPTEGDPPALTESAVLDREAVQRTVGDIHARAAAE